MINDRIVSSFVFLILVVSFIGCGSKPSKDIVENAVFTKYCNPDSMFSDIFINNRDNLTLDITNSFSRKVLVQGLGEETHYFFVVNIVFKNIKARNDYYQTIIDTNDWNEDSLNDLKEGYLKSKNMIVNLYGILYDDINVTIVRRGQNWYALNVS